MGFCATTEAGPTIRAIRSSSVAFISILFFTEQVKLVIDLIRHWKEIYHIIMTFMCFLEGY